MHRTAPITTVPVMPSEELSFIVELLQSSPLSVLTLEEQRAVIDGEGGTLPQGTEREAASVAGVDSEWVRTPAASDDVVILALRGGGYCLGSLGSNRRFAALLSEHCSAAVLNVGYRNAPEHPFPAALDDALAAYRSLLAAGVDPTRIVVAGNSAGGGLALACLLALRDAGEPLPAGVVALCPWTDLAATGESIAANAATEVLLHPAGVLDTAHLYAADDRLTEPYVSPLYGDLHDLPPILVQVSDAEILRDDAVRFARKAQQAGVAVTLEIFSGVPHVWHLFAGLLPEADTALRQVGNWVSRIISASAVTR